MQLGRTVRQPGKEHIHTGYEKSKNTNGFTLRRSRPQRGSTMRTGKKKRSRKLAKNGKPKWTSTRYKPNRSNRSQYIRRNTTQQRQSIQQRTGILQTRKSGPIPDCWKSGYKFIPGHLSNYTAKKEVCRICKKNMQGQYAKM